MPHVLFSFFFFWGGGRPFQHVPCAQPAAGRRESHRGDARETRAGGALKGGGAPNKPKGQPTFLIGESSYANTWLWVNHPFYFSGDWDVHRGYGLLTHGHIPMEGLWIDVVDWFSGGSKPCGLRFM